MGRTTGKNKSAGQCSHSKCADREFVKDQIDALGTFLQTRIVDSLQAVTSKVYQRGYEDGYAAASSCTIKSGYASLTQSNRTTNNSLPMGITKNLSAHISQGDIEKRFTDILSSGLQPMGQDQVSNELRSLRLQAYSNQFKDTQQQKAEQIAVDHFSNEHDDRQEDDSAQFESSDDDSDGLDHSDKLVLSNVKFREDYQRDLLEIRQQISSSPVHKQCYNELQNDFNYEPIVVFLYKRYKHKVNKVIVTSTFDTYMEWAKRLMKIMVDLSNIEQLPDALTQWVSTGKGIKSGESQYKAKMTPTIESVIKFRQKTVAFLEETFEVGVPNSWLTGGRKPHKRIMPHNEGLACALMIHLDLLDVKERKIRALNAFFMLMWLTGCRVSAALALRVKNVIATSQGRGATQKVVYQINLYEKKVAKRVRRNIPEALYEELIWVIEWRKEARRKLEQRSRSKEEDKQQSRRANYVFDCWSHRSSIYNCFTRLYMKQYYRQFIENGLLVHKLYGLQFHDLRRAHAEDSAKIGSKTEIAQEALGHSSKQMTSNYLSAVDLPVQVYNYYYPIVQMIRQGKASQYTFRSEVYNQVLNDKARKGKYKNLPQSKMFILEESDLDWLRPHDQQSDIDSEYGYEDDSSRDLSVSSRDGTICDLSSDEEVDKEAQKQQQQVVGQKKQMVTFPDKKAKVAAKKATAKEKARSSSVTALKTNKAIKGSKSRYSLNVKKQRSAPTRYTAKTN